MLFLSGESLILIKVPLIAIVKTHSSRFCQLYKNLTEINLVLTDLIMKRNYKHLSVERELEISGLHSVLNRVRKFRILFVRYFANVWVYLLYLYYL